jgi:plastocyanin
VKRFLPVLAAVATLAIPATAAAQAPVKAALEATQSGGKVTFDASRSTGAADYQWDLNADGTFETDSGATPTTSAVYPPGATARATVKITAADGTTSDQATAFITLPQKSQAAHIQSVAGEPATPKPKPKVVAAAAGGVTIKDFEFGPKTLTVNAGDTVTWTNQGPTGHSTTAKNGSWNSGVLAQGKSFSHKFTQPGTYQYFCEPHPFMTATIVVKGAASSSPSAGSGSSGSSGSSSTTPTPAAPAAATTNPNDLPNTGGNPFPWVALGVSFLVFGAALRWRLRTD